MNPTIKPSRKCSSYCAIELGLKFWKLKFTCSSKFSGLRNVAFPVTPSNSQSVYPYCPKTDHQGWKIGLHKSISKWELQSKWSCLPTRPCTHCSKQIYVLTSAWLCVVTWSRFCLRNEKMATASTVKQYKELFSPCSSKTGGMRIARW